MVANTDGAVAKPVGNTQVVKCRGTSLHRSKSNVLNAAREKPIQVMVTKPQHRVGSASSDAHGITASPSLAARYQVFSGAVCSRDHAVLKHGKAGVAFGKSKLPRFAAVEWRHQQGKLSGRSAVAGTTTRLQMSTASRSSLRSGDTPMIRRRASHSQCCPRVACRRSHYLSGVVTAACALVRRYRAAGHGQ